MFAPVVGDAGEQARQRARPVGHAREQHEPAADLGLVAARDRGEQPRVHVAAREHGDGGAGGGRRDVAAEQRGDADRARALDHELAALHQQHHRLGGLVLAHRDDVVDPLREQLHGQLARPLDRDAVGDRDRRLRLDRLAAPQRLHVGRARRHLHADHLDLRPRRLDRDRDPAAQPAAADRHDHLGEVGHVLEQLEPERALAGHDVGVVERVHEREPALARALLRRDQALVDRGAADVHDRALPARRLGLGDRRVGGDEHLAAARPSCARRRPPPARGCRPRRRRRRALQPCSPSAASFAPAPRTLKEPVRWRFSAFSATSAARALGDRAGREHRGPPRGRARRPPARLRCHAR